MFICNLQGLGSAISGNLGSILGKIFFVRYAPTDGGAPLRQCNILPPFRTWEPPPPPPPLGSTW